MATSKDTNIQYSYSQEHFWYILYTYPRAEKKVYKDLINKEVEAFLPCIKTISKWKNRQKKLIEKVLFPGYIFVKTSENLLYALTRIQGVSTLVSCGNRPSIIKQTEIDCIKKMLELNSEIITENTLDKDSQAIKIISGPFAGYEGVICNRRGKILFGIELKGINQLIFVDININKLQVLN